MSALENYESGNEQTHELGHQLAVVYGGRITHGFLGPRFDNIFAEEIYETIYSKKYEKAYNDVVEGTHLLYLNIKKRATKQIIQFRQ